MKNYNDNTVDFVRHDNRLVPTRAVCNLSSRKLSPPTEIAWYARFAWTGLLFKLMQQLLSVCCSECTCSVSIAVGNNCMAKLHIVVRALI